MLICAASRLGGVFGCLFRIFHTIFGERYLLVIFFKALVKFENFLQTIEFSWIVELSLFYHLKRGQSLLDFLEDAHTLIYSNCIGV